MSMETVARQTPVPADARPGGDLRVAGQPRAAAAASGASPRGITAGWAGSSAVSVVSALLAVATPLLAGRVVDAIVHGGAAGVGRGAGRRSSRPSRVAEAGVSLVTRWLSSTIGEGLILDLRTAVFDHVQRMPVAFFTRTRTGALVSRLGNDVIGAQRAFSDTLSGVVTNIVTLTLTLVVMLSISWQITLLSLVLMPLFLLPARRIGRTMARLSPREPPSTTRR